jgi:hypothetical protein
MISVNSHARSSYLLCFTLITLGLQAQEQKIASTEAKPQTGTIEGHVICGDTRSPARLATVFIIPIPTFDASGNSTHPKVNGGDITKTNLDGNYTLPKIAPGDYFVLAELRGYLPTTTKLRWSELRDPTPDSIRKLAKLLPAVHIEPDKTAHADVVLQRGASISGKVIYDDGAPAIGILVRLDPAKDDPGNDHQIIGGITSSWALVTDDRGRYRIDGLSDGEYVVETSMGAIAPGNNPLAMDYAPLPEKVYGEDWNTTYSEKTLHKKNAKVYKLASGEEMSDADIEIPLNGLYSISGAVTVQGNQPPIVFGYALLVDLDDKTFTRRAVIHSDGSFQFPYLPPAKYRLKTASLSDQSPIRIFGEERKPSYAYPEASTAVEIIDQNLSGITLVIPEAPKAVPADPQKALIPGTTR